MSQHQFHASSTNQTQNRVMTPSNNDKMMDDDASSAPPLLDISCLNLTQDEIHSFSDYNDIYNNRIRSLQELNQELTPDLKAKAILSSFHGIPDTSPGLKMAALLAYVAVYNPSFNVKHLARPSKTAFSENTVDGDTSLPQQFQLSEQLQKDLHYLMDSNQEFMLLPKEKRKELNGKIQHNFIYLSSSSKSGEPPHTMKQVVDPLSKFYIQKYSNTLVISLDLDSELFHSSDSALQAVYTGIMAAICNTSIEEIKSSFNSMHELFQVDNIFRALHWMTRETFQIGNQERVNLLLTLHGMDSFKDTYQDDSAWMDPLFELASRSIAENEKIDICLVCMGSRKLYSSVGWERDGFACEELPLHV